MLSKMSREVCTTPYFTVFLSMKINDDVINNGLCTFFPRLMLMVET